jgi:uncharacterized protein involved in outer membrane biogenesis
VTARRKFLYASLSVLLVVILAGVAFSALVGPDALMSFFLHEIEHNVGRKIDVGQVKLEVFPTLRITMSDVVVWDLEPPHTFLRAKRVDYVVRLLPLLRKQVIAKRLLIEEPRVELRRDRMGRWNVASLADAAKEQTDPTIGSPFVRFLLTPQTRIANGTVTVIDEFRQDGIRSIRVQALDVLVSGRPDASRGDILASGTVSGPHGVSALTLRGFVTRSQVKGQIAPDYRAAPVEGFQFEGTVQAGNLSLTQVAEFLGPRASGQRARTTGSFQAQIKVAPGVLGYDVLLSEMKATVEHLSVTGQASLSGVMSAQPTFSFSFTAPPVDIRYVMERVPVQWLSPSFHQALVEHQIAGTLEVVTASITGAATPDMHLSLTGEFQVRNGRAVVGQSRKPVSQLAALVSVHPDRIKVSNIEGLYDQMLVIGGTATVTYPQSGAWLELDVPGEMTAQDLVPWLKDMVGPHDPERVLEGMSDVRGAIALRFKLAGPLRGGAGLAITSAEFDGRNVGFRSHLWPEAASGVSGRVVVASGRVELSRVAGLLGQSRFALDGVIVTDPQAIIERLALQLKGSRDQLAQLFPGGPLWEKALEGPVAATLALSGSLMEPVIRGTLDLKEATVDLPGVLHKGAGAPGSLDFDGTASRTQGLTLTRFEISLPPVRISGKGTIQLGKTYAINASIITGPVKVAEVPKGLSVGGLQAGTLELSLDVKGSGRDPSAWQLGGWIALTDGRLAPQGLEAPLTDIYLRVKLARDTADIKRLAFKIAESDLSVSGKIRHVWKNPSVWLAVESTQLDLDLLVPKGERSPIRDVLERVAHTTRVAMNVSIERGVYKTTIFTGLAARVLIRDGAVTVDRLMSGFEEGQLTGRVQVRLPRGKRAAGDVSARFTHVPFETFLHLIGDDRRNVTGSLFGTMTLRANGRDPLGVLHSLNGNLEFRVEKGRVQRGVVVPKIVKLLNLPKLLEGEVDLTGEGLPFDVISGTFTVTNGMMISQDFALDGPIIKMTAAGSADLVNDRIDMIVAVSPLGSYSKLLKSIPLFGKLFAGERQGIDTAMFEIRGRYRDPQVSYLPIESFATGVRGLAMLAFDMLKNLVMLPAEMIAPDEQERAPAKGAASPVQQQGGETPPASPAPAPPLAAPPKGDTPAPMRTPPAASP